MSAVALRHRRPVAEGLEISRNLMRRRLRSMLTVGGIAIGVVALTTLGSMAELAGAQLAGGESFLADHILVQVANQAGSNLVTPEALAAIREIPGVEGAYPTVAMPAEAVPPTLGSQESLLAFDPVEFPRLYPKLPIAEGRALGAGDSGVVVVGAGFASRHNLVVGSVVTLPLPSTDRSPAPDGRRFTVVGIWKRTLAAPDQWAQIGLEDATGLVAASLPTGVDFSVIANGADVYGRPGADLDWIAREIEDSIAGLRAIPPSQTRRAFESLGALYTALTMGSAVVALVVGGLSVVNTMLMAVTDRVREIGIKKAIGAPSRRIIGELLAEAAVLGTLGGLAGVTVGWVLATALNGIALAAGNFDLFLLTPRLLVAAPVFAIGLSVLSGLLPAARAARLDAAMALRVQE
jgi:putative ABC transport system permease protein